MLALDGTFIVILASFIVFLVFMKTQFFTPVMAIKTERENTIAAGHQVSKEAEDKTTQLTEACRVQLAEAKRKAQLVISEKREIAKGNAQQKLTEARDLANQHYDAQARQLQSQSQSVYNNLASQKDELVQLILARLSSLTGALTS